MYFSMKESKGKVMKNTVKKNSKKEFLKFTVPYRGKYVLSIIFSVLGVGAGLLPYYCAAQLIIGLIGGEQEFSYYIIWSVWAVAGYILKSTFSVLSTNVSHTATFNLLKDIRQALIEKLYRMPMGQVLNKPSGQLKDILVDRVEGLETPLAHLLPEMSANILVPVVILIYLFVLDWRMALISLITIPLGMACYSSVMKTYPEQYAGSVAIAQRMASAIVEYVNGIEVIKAFNQSSVSYKKYADAVKDNGEYFYQWMKSCQWATAAFTAICPGVLITVLPAGVLFYLNGSILIENLLTIIILSLGLVGPLIAISNFADSLGTVGTVVSEIEELLASNELNRPKYTVELKNENILIDNVSFAYLEQGKNAIENINIEIKPKTMTAFVGPSGSGKSTVTKLIAGFWDVDDGRIYLGGKELKEIPQEQLADQIAYVAQDNFLLDDTVRENIRIGCLTASDEEVEDAAKAAGCHEFICSLENGYDTMVGSAGGHLSGGERQRIAIARAMLKDAPIVILDEATAYIDPENESIVQRAVSQLVADKTLIIIAHRLSTIVDADMIVVMKDGKISAKGTHQELLDSSELYRNMWQAHVGVKDGENL